MIIVENKGINTINIPKNSLSNIKYSGGNVDLSDYYTKEEVDELIDNVEVDLTNYYTKEQVDELIASSKIPYIYVVQVENDVFEYAEGTDFEGVRQAIINHKPYFIYIPSVLGYYSTPTNISRTFGQINANVFAYTNSGIHYYIRYTLTSDNISVTEEKIEYATTSDLLKYGVYGLIVNYNEEFNEYTYNGVGFSTLKQSIENGEKQYAIYLPNSENTYRVAAQEIVVDGDEIKCKTIETNGNTQITTNWIIGEDEDGYEYCKKGATSTINIATQEWIEQQGYLTEIPSEYVTDTELNDAIDGLGGSDVPYVVIEYRNATTLTTISGDLQATLNAAKNKQPFLAYFYNTYNAYGKPKTLYPFTYVTVETSGFSLQYHTEVGSVHKDVVVNGSYDTTTGEYSLSVLGTATHSYVTSTELNSKQDTLVSGENIKTINGNSILGSGDLEITTDLSNYYTKSEIDTQIGDINTILENIIG